jgi:hypothetical protein
MPNKYVGGKIDQKAGKQVQRGGPQATQQQ